MSRPQIFMSYARKDKGLEGDLKEQLEVLERARGIKVWDDRKIRSGDEWSPKLELEINKSSVAILMITARFLNSSYIQETELPYMMSRRDIGKLEVVPVLTRACPWHEVRWLGALEMRPRDARPLAKMRPADREEAMATFASEVAEIAIDVARRNPGLFTRATAAVTSAAVVGQTIRRDGLLAGAAVAADLSVDSP
jgi:hypothetical protein